MSPSAAASFGSLAPKRRDDAGLPNTLMRFMVASCRVAATCENAELGPTREAFIFRHLQECRAAKNVLRRTRCGRADTDFKLLSHASFPDKQFQLSWTA